MKDISICLCLVLLACMALEADAVIYSHASGRKSKPLMRRAVVDNSGAETNYDEEIRDASLEETQQEIQYHQAIVLPLIGEFSSGDGCTSPDGRGGQDCWVCPGEAMSCSDKSTGVATGNWKDGGKLCKLPREYTCNGDKSPATIAGYIRYNHAACTG